MNAGRCCTRRTTLVIGPAAVRYPRGTGPGVAARRRDERASRRQARELRREGRSGLAILAFGAMLTPARRIAERLDATLVNMRFIKPLDQDLIVESRRATARIVTIEENAVMGGAGSAVSEVLGGTWGIIAGIASGHSGPIHRAWLA